MVILGACFSLGWVPTASDFGAHIPPILVPHFWPSPYQFFYKLELPPSDFGAYIAPNLVATIPRFWWLTSSDFGAYIVEAGWD